MPYEGEFAHYRSIRRLVNSSRVKKLMQRARIQDYASDESTLPTIKTSEIPASGWKPKFVIAIDGSYQRTPVETGYPGAEVGYVIPILLNIMLFIFLIFCYICYKSIDDRININETQTFTDNRKCC